MKLEIETVIFKNFLSYGNKTIEIPFKKGVNLVLGKDLITGRSNGSGKSSFLETIPFALFGQTHKDIKKSQLLNWKNRKNLEVALKFKRGENEYIVARTIKPDNLEIYENNSLIEKPAHVKDYQNVLEEIIGLNYQTFCSLIHSNINSSNRILSMGKPEKRKFIENVFGLEIYSLISAKALEKIRSTEEKLHEIELKNQTVEKMIEEYKSQITIFNEKLKTLTSKEPELKEAAYELKEFENEHPDIQNRYQKLLNDINGLKDDQLKLSKLDTRINSKHLLIEKWIKDVDNKLCKVAVVKQQQKIYFAFVKEHGKPSEILDKLTEIKNNIDKNAKRAEKDLANKTVLEIELAKIETILSAEEDKYDNLKIHKECPTCGTILKSADKDILKTISEKIKMLRIDFELKTKEWKRQESILNETGKERMSLHHEQVELERKRDQIYQLKDQVKTDLDEDKLKLQKERYIRVSECLQSQLGKTETGIYKIDSKLIGLNIKKEELEKIIAEFKIKNDKIELLKEKIKLENQTRKEYQAIIDTNKKKIESLLVENQETEKKRQQFINISDYLNLIREICKDDNIKQYAISSIMPYLNQRTNYYLSEVGYSFYTILNRWIEAEIRGPGVTNATYGSLSGGESRGIDLALQFSFLDIAKVQAGIWPDILIMDEILDSSVDSAGIGKLMNIIRTKQVNEDNKIFIISHRDEVDDIEVDNTYFVTKESYSRLEIK